MTAPIRGLVAAAQAEQPPHAGSGADLTGGDPSDVLAELLPELNAYFWRRLGDPDDAADAAADTLLVLVAKGARLPASREQVRQYAFGVARKVLLRARRGRVRHSELGERLRHELTAVSVSPPEAHPELRRALSALPERDRELLLLVAWEGFGVAEAGQVLGYRAAAARKRYSRVRAALRAELSG